MAEPLKPETVQQAFSLIKFIGDHWLTILFGLIGIIGTIASIISVASSKRFKKENEYLLKLADLHIKKDISEKTIEEKKNEEKELKEKIQDLQNKVKREIPIEAKRAVLLDRYEGTISILKDSYRDLIKTNNELKGNWGRTKLTC